MKTIKNLTAEELRKSILQLAIQGKLVKQNPDDEPASELVKRIYEEKNKLVSEGKIKKDKNQSYIFKGDDNCYYEQVGKEINKLDDIPFEIPDSWTWLRFPNLVDFYLGKTPERHNNKYWDNGIYPWFSISDMKDKQVVFNTKEKISQNSFEENFSSRISPAGTLIMSFKLTVGRVSILGVDALHNEAIISIFPYLKENNCIRDWLLYTLGLLVDYVEQTGAIKGNTLNKEKLSKMYIPLPPLKEQSRIIEKINDIEPILEQYEKIEKDLSLLENEFEEKLKKSILQFAIEGKLVQQDPTDEPATLLLERIKKGKEQLIKDGKIKREKNENLLIQDDYKNYYENLPLNWACERIGNILTIERGGSPRPISQFITKSEDGYNWIKIGDTIKGSKYIKSTKEKIRKEGLKSSRYVEVNDFILSNSMSFGRPYILKTNGCIHDGWLVIRKPELCFNTDYLFYLLSSNFVYKQFCESAAGAVVSNLNIDKVKSTIVFVPPLNEQIKIAEKIEFIFQLID